MRSSKNCGSEESVRRAAMTSKNSGENRVDLYSYFELVSEVQQRHEVCVFLHSTLFVVSKMIVPIHYVKEERKVSQCNGFQM